MNLNNFEHKIDDVIVDRGLDYYHNGHVKSLEFEDGEWIAKVSGSEYYYVTVALLENGEIEYSHCDCPYDFGEYCKHQVATLYALKNRSSKALQSGEKPKSKKVDLKSVLSSQPNEALVSILLEYAENNKHIKNDLLLRFSEPENIVEQARNLIKSSVKNAMHKGFVDYGYTGQAVDGAEKVLRMVENMSHTESPLSCVKLYIMVLEETMELLDCCDDSNGEVCEVIEDAIRGFESVTSNLNERPSVKTEIFELILNHALSSLYSDWASWRIDILRSCVPFCDNTDLRNRLEKNIKDKCTSHYDMEYAQALMLRIKENYDGEEAADAYRLENIDNSDFRRAMISKFMLQENFERALQLCLDGEAKDTKHVGLVRQWQKMRYEIYERIADVPAQIHLARIFILNGDFEFFSKYKALHLVDEWPTVLEKLLKEFDKRNNRTYIKILIAEDLKSLIFEECKRNVLLAPELYKCATRCVMKSYAA